MILTIQKMLANYLRSQKEDNKKETYEKSLSKAKIMYSRLDKTHLWLYCQKSLAKKVLLKAANSLMLTLLAAKLGLTSRRIYNWREAKLYVCESNACFAIFIPFERVFTLTATQFFLCDKEKTNRKKELYEQH
jgi:hypothetical protein